MAHRSFRGGGQRLFVEGLDANELTSGVRAEVPYAGVIEFEGHRAPRLRAGRGARFLNGNRTAGSGNGLSIRTRGYPVIHPYNRTRVQMSGLSTSWSCGSRGFYGGIDIYATVPDEIRHHRGPRVLVPRERDSRRSLDGPAYFASLLPTFQDPRAAAARWVEDNTSAAPPGADISAANAWLRMLDFAAKYDEPGTFTALVGWEWSTIPGGANLHRVVLTDADHETAREFMPFASTDSPFPEDLWDWMDGTGERIGARFVAIPHNSNISRGTMFSPTTMPGNRSIGRMRRSAGADRSRRDHPDQGDSETHPRLSPDDPFADFELYPWYILQQRTRDYIAMRADYVHPLS